MNAFKSAEGKKAVIKYYSSLLEKAEIPLEEMSIHTSYGNAFVIAAGNKENPPLILLHGSSMNSAMWLKDIEHYSAQYRVYAPDLPGEPGRSSDEQLPFDTMDYVDWLCDVIDMLSITEVSLVGISLGAWLSAKFAIHYPGKVNKLVLLCPAGIGGQNHAFKDIAMSLLPKGDEGVAELFRLINGGVPVREAVLNYQKFLVTVFNTRQEPIPLFADEELCALTMPCLLIVGEKDIMIDSLETVSRVKKLVSKASIMLIPDAGHILIGYAKKISHFLQM